MSTRHLSRQKRGFVLIVALMLAVATAAVAVGLIQTSGSANVAVTHTNAGEAARALAEAGMARATSYALTISRPRVDFDRVLDPGATFGAAGQADCSELEDVTNSGVVPETGNMYLPLFTDTGTAIVTFEGLRYRMVPYNGGAYLVRFSDNFDDGPSAPMGSAIDWSASTSNTLSGAPDDNAWCAEGPTAPTAVPTPGINGVNNPARDRDRTIYATVIGIYPGTDPTASSHRTVLSKVVMDGRVLGPAGMRVGGNMNVANGAEVELCSEVSGINTTGSINTGPPGSCACGSVASTAVVLNDGDCGACCGSNPYEAVTGSSPPAPSVPVVRDPLWYDYSSSCNFYMDPGRTGAAPRTGRFALYFWDATGTRGTGACNLYNANLPTPSTDYNNWGSCWVPLWYDADVTDAVDAFAPLGISGASPSEVGFGGVCGAAGAASCVASWRPRNTSVTQDIGSAAPAANRYYTSGPGSISVTKPDWSVACPRSGAASDFRWNPPQVDSGTGEDVRCAPALWGGNGCDGTRIALQASESQIVANSPRVFQPVQNPRAVPAGVYFLADSFHVLSSHAVPGAQMPLSTNAWPMMTLIVEGSVTMNNATDLVLGVGTRKRFFPSLVVNGNLSTDMGAQLALAGSLYVIGNVTFDHGNAGGTFLYGRAEITGNFTQQSGSRVDWNYDTDLFAAGVVRRAAEPRIALPLGF